MFHAKSVREIERGREGERKGPEGKSHPCKQPKVFKWPLADEAPGVAGIAPQSASSVRVTSFGSVALAPYSAAFAKRENSLYLSIANTSAAA